MQKLILLFILLSYNIYGLFAENETKQNSYVDNGYSSINSLGQDIKDSEVLTGIDTKWEDINNSYYSVSLNYGENEITTSSFQSTESEIGLYFISGNKISNQSTYNRNYSEYCYLEVEIIKSQKKVIKLKDNSQIIDRYEFTLRKCNKYFSLFGNNIRIFIFQNTKIYA
ncbi:MAG: hypothetical protein KG003_13710 [Bacteroidetes bacterium]|nr:hypothetical protein [Bacteroidota bacterium]